MLHGHDQEILTHLLKARKSVITSTENQGNSTYPLQEPPVHPEQSEGGEDLDTSNTDKILYQSGELHFTVWGGIDVSQLHRLKINLHVQLNGNSWKYYQDDVNLYKQQPVAMLY